MPTVKFALDQRRAVKTAADGGLEYPFELGRIEVTLDDAFDRFARHLPDDARNALTPQLRKLANLQILGRRQTTSLDPQRDHFVFMASGTGKLVALDADGAEQIVGFQFADDLLYLPCDALSAYRLAVIRPAALLIFDAEALRLLEQHVPTVSEALRRCLLTALQRTRTNLVVLGRRTATERVASFLIAMREVEQVAAGDRRKLVLEMTRKEIADCLGLTVETVSRQFTKLRALGLITTPSRTLVCLHDPARLAAEAGAFARES